MQPRLACFQQLSSRHSASINHKLLCLPTPVTDGILWPFTHHSSPGSNGDVPQTLQTALVLPLNQKRVGYHCYALRLFSAPFTASAFFVCVLNGLHHCLQVRMPYTSAQKVHTRPSRSFGKGSMLLEMMSSVNPSVLQNFTWSPESFESILWP